MKTAVVQRRSFHEHHMNGAFRPRCNGPWHGADIAGSECNKADSKFNPIRPSRTCPPASAPGMFRWRTDRRAAHLTITFAPLRTRSNRSATSLLRMRMQPEETLRPIVHGSLVPWMRYRVSRPF